MVGIYKVVNEELKEFYYDANLRKARKIAKAVAIKNNENTWIIDPFKDREIAMYNNKGIEE